MREVCRLKWNFFACLMFTGFQSRKISLGGRMDGVEFYDSDLKNLRKSFLVWNMLIRLFFLFWFSVPIVVYHGFVSFLVDSENRIGFGKLRNFFERLWAENKQFDWNETSRFDIRSALFRIRVSFEKWIECETFLSFCCIFFSVADCLFQFRMRILLRGNDFDHLFLCFKVSLPGNGVGIDIRRWCRCAS